MNRKNTTTGNSISIQGLKKTNPLGIFSFLIPQKYRFKNCSLRKATHLYIDSEKQVIPVLELKIGRSVKTNRYNIDGHVRFVYILHDRYIYDKAIDRFVIPPTPDFMKMSIDNILNNCQVIDQLQDILLYGVNELKIDIKSVYEILIDNIWNRLYLITALSMVVYLCIHYEVYLMCIFIVVAYSLYCDIKAEVEAQQGIIKIAGFGVEVIVFRNGRWINMNSKYLVPGDIIQIEKVESFSIDVRIISGECVIDESFLTGECVPVNKTSDMVIYAGTKVLISKADTDFEVSKISKDKLVAIKNFARMKKNKADDRRNENEQILNGTCRIDNVANKCENAIGVCISTGFRTTKGKLLKNLLLIGPPNIKFYTEASNIIRDLFFYALPLFFVVFVFLVMKHGFSLYEAFKYDLDLLFVIITPSLSTSILVGASLALDRLKKSKIFCFSKERINSAGYVNLCVFDKTGTITENGLDMHGLDNIIEFKETANNCSLEVKIGLGCCHDLVMIDGELLGDPLEVRMFNFSGARKVEKEFIISTAEFDSQSSEEIDLGDKDTLRVKILKVFEFDSNLRRMSTLVEYEGRRLLITKGSPESIKILLNKVPHNYDETVNEYGLDGYRVLSLCCRSVDNADDERNDLEKNLNFLTFIIFANKPKPASASVILELRNANIKTMMATGDNILTAISVAKEVSMIDESMPVLFPRIYDESAEPSEIEWMCISEEDLLFDKIKLCLYNNRDRETYTEFIVAMEGREYDFFRTQKYYAEFMKTKAVIFARMNPDQKKSLVEDMAEDYTTCFCGDGANDCGALKAAEVGISLCSGEVSIAGTFSSENKDITCVLEVIKEGRAALVGSICRFKFIMMTSITLYIGLLCLIYKGQYFYTTQELHFDILSVLIISFLMSDFKASEVLAKTLPSSIIIDRKTFLFFLVSFTTTFISSLILTQVCEVTKGIESTKPASKEFNTTGELITAIFFIVLFKAYIIGYLLSEGYPHREEKHKNLFFLSFMIIMLGLNFCFLFGLLVDNPHKLYEFLCVATIKNKTAIVWFLGCIIGTFVIDIGLWHAINKKSHKNNHDNNQI